MRLALLKFSFLIITSWIFTWLLFAKAIGINLPLFETTVIAGIVTIFQHHIFRRAWVFLVIWLLTSFAVVFVNTQFSIWMNVFTFIFLCISILWNEISHPLLGFCLVFLNIFRAQQHQWSKFFIYRKAKGRGGRFFRFFLIAFIILCIMVLFIILYKNSSEYFNKSIAWFNEGINQFFNYLFDDRPFVKIMFFLWGFTMISALSIKTMIFPQLIVAQQKPDLLRRQRYHLSKSGLRKGIVHERNFGIALLVGLNLLILLQNFLDIRNIWIDFVWDGALLKQFVHAGTYILILSIILSAAIVLYLFRRNQNFYRNNKWLRILTYIWLGQNVILAVSVAVRNFWYIKYFNLAYLRIGVFIFLVLVIMGLALVVYKIAKRQTNFSVLGKGILYTFIILVFFSFFNWDMIIVRYNIAHSDQAYFHHDFMITMPDKTLAIIKESENLFNFSLKTDTLNIYTREYFGCADTAINYSDLLHYRYAKFEHDWNSNDWKSWNYPEAEAYRKLFRK